MDIEHLERLIQWDSLVEWDLCEPEAPSMERTMGWWFQPDEKVFVVDEEVALGQQPREEGMALSEWIQEAKGGREFELGDWRML
jgi:hypothetical protein